MHWQVALDLPRESNMTVLSDEAVLVYILTETGVRGHLTQGHVRRGPAGTLDVFDVRGTRIDYLSGKRLRSWCLFDVLGNPIEGWREIQPEDLPKMFPN